MWGFWRADENGGEKQFERLIEPCIRSKGRAECPQRYASYAVFRIRVCAVNNLSLCAFFVKSS